MAITFGCNCKIINRKVTGSIPVEGTHVFLVHCWTLIFDNHSEICSRSTPTLGVLLARSCDLAQSLQMLSHPLNSRFIGAWEGTSSRCVEGLPFRSSRSSSNKRARGQKTPPKHQSRQLTLAQWWQLRYILFAVFELATPPCFSFSSAPE